jgi:hypothetical protein
MNRRDRTVSLSPLPTTRRLLPRPQYRNRSLMEWREPDQIIKDQVSCWVSETLVLSYVSIYLISRRRSV